MYGMDYDLSSVRSSYIRLYGEEKADEIDSIIDQAREIAANTGDDAVLTAEAMLSDTLN